MTFTTEQTAQLAAPLSRENVSSREGAGRRQLSYIESHHAIREANRIFGFDGWSSETVELRCIVEKPGECSYLARVRVTVFAGERVLVREGVGAGHGKDHNIGQAHEKASKEAESDAQKRALRHFGDQFGLALYDKTQEHVTDEIPSRGGSAAALAAPTAEARSPSISQRASAGIVDPKRAALEARKPPAAVPRRPVEPPAPVSPLELLARNESQGLHDLLMVSLGECKDTAQLVKWNDDNGRGTGKWDGMHADHIEAVLIAAKSKLSELRAKRAA